MMCENCYREYGSPAALTPAVLDAVELVKAVYEHNAAGGSLHCMVDDWNIGDSDFAFHERVIAEGGYNASQEQLDAETACLKALKTLTVKERATVLALHGGHYQGWIDHKAN